MADIFFSYSQHDQKRILPIAKALEEQGWSVFWDRKTPPGQTWRSYIGRALDDAKIVVVAWSEHSVNSEWVIEESDIAKGKGILFPVSIDKVNLPFGFSSVQAADLTTWNHGSKSAEWDGFVNAINVFLNKIPEKDKLEDGEPKKLAHSQPKIRGGFWEKFFFIPRWYKIILGVLGVVEIIFIVEIIDWVESVSSSTSSLSENIITNSLLFLKVLTIGFFIGLLFLNYKFPLNDSPVDWSLESFKLAREDVYLNGDLKGSTNKQNAPQVPENYGKKSKKVGEERIVLAGYRLARIL